MKKQYCIDCEKPLEKNEIGLNKKLLGDSSKYCYCLHCLANFLDVTEEELKNKIEDFKAEGCKLFS